MTIRSKSAPRAVPDEAQAASTGPAADRVTHVRIGAAAAGQRLDNFLLRIAKGVPKSHVYRIVRSGEVRVNRARATADQRLVEGDELRLPPMRLAQPAAGRAVARPGLPPVLFEDEHLLAVDKPPGMAAHGGSGVSFGLIEMARAARPQQDMLELAHRLDRDTSGILLLAKSRRALLALHRMLQAGEVDKRYLALVAGDWVNDRQHVKASLTKFVTKAGERRVAVDAEGMLAHTVFNLRERFGTMSLVEAELKTGRTHQIRVHLAHLGFPIVGDDKYGDFDLNKRVARPATGPALDRMFLHAWRIALPHPVTGAELALEAPLPADCQRYLEGLRQHATV
jgi:23S rRNA pseudouridine955/2504/2580 synthase